MTDPKLFKCNPLNGKFAPQLDVEMSFVEMKDIQDLIEDMLVYSWPEDRSPLTVPFERMKYHDAIRLYGSDKPDTRFDMQVRKTL